MNENMEQQGTDLYCNLFDNVVVMDIRQALLSGLAKACVGVTAGLFTDPTSVADGMKTEMVEFLVQKAERAIDDNSDLTKASTDPAGFVSDKIDAFLQTKLNLYNRVSGFFTGGGREKKKIDNFVREMQNSFWPLEERTELAESIVKHIDLNNTFHCPKIFEVAEELAEHKTNCEFRLVDCVNEGCPETYSAIHTMKHDAICPFKVLPCEQKCEQRLVRSQMKAHMQSVCPMKIINCNFYDIGCREGFPQRDLEQHNASFLQSHLLSVLQALRKQDGSVKDLTKRLELLEKEVSLSKFSEALDMRDLSLLTKEQEAKVKKLEQQLMAQEARMKKLEEQLHAATAAEV